MIERERTGCVFAIEHGNACVCGDMEEDVQERYPNRALRPTVCQSFAYWTVKIAASSPP